jgi:hypothetical protein
LGTLTRPVAIPSRATWIESASVPVSRPAACNVYGIFRSSAVVRSNRCTTGLTIDPRESTGPPPSGLSPISFFSMPGVSVACVTSTTIAIAAPLAVALTPAPPPRQEISSCVVATATTRALPGFFA